MYNGVLIAAFLDEMEKISMSSMARISKPPSIKKMQNAAMRTPKVPLQTTLPSHSSIPLPPPSPMSTIQPMVANLG
mgnify:CR=1 FL=1